MKLFSVCLGAALVMAIQGQTDCDYDYICDDTGSPDDLKLSAPSPYACYKACRDYVDPDGGVETCDFWTYYEELGFGRSFDEANETEVNSVDGKLRANGKPVCRRLKYCETKFDKSSCGSAVGGAKCASGPGSCEVWDICPPMAYTDDSTVSHWSCDINSPYRKTNGLPEGTTCRTKCTSQSWTSGNFAEATCESNPDKVNPGLWTLSVDTSTVTDSNGAAVDPETDPSCLCDSIILGPHQLPNADGTTNEIGATFFCKDDGPLIDNGNGANTMESTTKCTLNCNGHLALDIQCNAGSWTSGVQSEKDIYCFGPPQDCAYQPSANDEVCTCSDGAAPPNTVTNVCAAGEGCQADGTCIIACDPDPVAVGADCQCQTKDGGVICVSGSTCTIDGCV